ncbi:MAG: glucose-6-phosphate dehydrogenase, partial [Nanoarchaeota archaeon]|nr:glucose-6-phosphate dehydrogenase [Nanoarchaeota archaeon]
LKLEIDNPRWKGVPFFLKTGKFLDKRETSIHLKFMMVDCLLTRNCPTDSNYLTIKVQPDEGILFEMNAKVPGETYQVRPVTMEFAPSRLQGFKSLGAYANLLNLVIEGDQSVFVRDDEIEAAWKIIDEIKKKKSSLYTYTKGSKGPKELEEWSRKNKVKWRS